MVGKKPTEVKEGDIWRVERPSFLVINITEGIATPLKVLLDPFLEKTDGNSPKSR